MESTIVYVCFLLSIICSNIPVSLQDCDRPTNLNPDVIITPDQATYLPWYTYTASCPAGYALTGPTTYYCYAGTPDYWDPDPSSIACTAAAQCSPPSFIDPNVIYEPDQPSYAEYEQITFSCAEGYKLAGTSQSLCLSDGSWDYVAEPTCDPQCAAPANSNGTGYYDEGSDVSFSCDPKYQLEVGGVAEEATCSAGEWSPAVNCLAGCSHPVVPSGVSYTWAEDPEQPAKDPGVTGVHNFYDRVDFTCDGERTLSGPSYSYCETTQEWSPDPSIIKCHDKCLVPPFSDSRLIHSSDLTKTSGQPYYDNADTMRFSCENDLFVDGPWRASCDNGTWSARMDADRPTCRSNCTGPVNTDVANEAFQHGMAHVFSCVNTPGLVRMGGPRAFCNDGAWKPRIKCAFKIDL